MRKLMVFTLSALLIGSLSACGGPAEEQPVASAPASPPASTQVSAAIEDSDYYFRDGVLVNPDVRIEITGWQVVPAGQGYNEYGEKPLLVFWYDTTNLTDSDSVTPLTAWTHVFTAVQDTDPDRVNVLTPGVPPVEFAEIQLEYIKPGGTVSSAISYQLDSDAVPVVLQALSGITIDGLGTQTFEIKQ